MPGRFSPTSRINEASESAKLLPILRDSCYSKSLATGLAIMSCFTQDRPVLGVSQIGDILGMHRSTTHRYIITLVALGYLEQVNDRKYRLSLATTRLGMGTMNGISLQEHAGPLLRELYQRIGYTVSLAILDGPVIQYLDRMPGSRRERHPTTKIDIGSRLPVDCTAMGKLLLAFLPTAPRRAILGELTLTKATPRTITSKSQLHQELRKIHATGIAVSDEELQPGFLAIAVPVRDVSREVVAAVSIAADRSVIDIEVFTRGLSPHLISITDQISARLGYRREDESYGPR
jgi:IclR family pca regulon transcriptional regulator